MERTSYHGFVVINDANKVVPCTDAGHSGQHVPVWASAEIAARFAETMARLNPRIDYSVASAIVDSEP